MQKERVELFGDRARLAPPTRRGSDAPLPVGRGFIRAVALGMAVFSLIFMMCCFWVGLNESAGSPPLYADGECEVGCDTSDAACAQTTAASPQSSPPPIAETEQPSERGSIYDFDLSAVPAGETPIIPFDLSYPSFGKGYIYNSTSYTPDTEALSERRPSFFTGGDLSDAPLVLIVHTHGTEAYSPEGAVSYDGVDQLARSSDISLNVVAVGAEIARVLEGRGISCVHCTVMHDELSYRDSYSRSAATIQRYMEQYPSIRLVVDVHRDSVTDADGALLRPIADADGRTAAQLMMVVGSDESGAEHPTWQDNLSLALILRGMLDQKCENLCRPVCLRPSAYNQQYAPLSILLEVGASGNYLSEALVAGEAFADTLADLIKK